MDKICIVCGATFQSPHSSKRVTCGLSACVTVNKQRTHTGKHNQWSNEAKTRIAEKGQTPNLQKGTPAARKSLIAGPFETNRNAKVWYLLSPDHVRYEVVNLRKFCRDHAELFAPDSWPNACAGIRQIQACLMHKTKRTVSQ